MVRSVNPSGQWKVLVLDAACVRVISSAVRMYDIMSEGITLVEALEKKRQPFPQLEAMYVACFSL